MEPLATVVLLLLVVPVLMVMGWVFLLFLAGACGNSPQRLRKTFLCPWRRRVVTVDFVVPAGAEHPAAVTRCTAFHRPEQIGCDAACRELAVVRSTVSAGLFPRWSLIADGLSMAERDARAPAVREPLNAARRSEMGLSDLAQLAPMEPCGFYPWRRPPPP